jgi:hypothetical protein
MLAAEENIIYTPSCSRLAAGVWPVGLGSSSFEEGVRCWYGIKLSEMWDSFKLQVPFTPGNVGWSSKVGRMTTIFVKGNFTHKLLQRAVALPCQVRHATTHWTCRNPKSCRTVKLFQRITHQFFQSLIFYFGSYVSW